MGVKYDKILGRLREGGGTEEIEALIPPQASPQNQLADKNFVNSSIATNTATFMGTVNVVTDLNLHYNAANKDIADALEYYSDWKPDNNDYCFVQMPISDEDPREIAEVRRFKYVESDGHWNYEYTLNNSGYTAAQWAAINSGITSAAVTKLTNLPSKADLDAALANKPSKISVTDIAAITGAVLDTLHIGDIVVEKSNLVNNTSEDIAYVVSYRDDSTEPGEIDMHLVAVTFDTITSVQYLYSSGAWAYVQMKNVPELSDKADKIHVVTTMPTYFQPNTLYELGNLFDNVMNHDGAEIFLLAAPTDNTIVNIYTWTFTTEARSYYTPNIAWPDGITWAGDTGQPPTVQMWRKYEISIMNGVAMYSYSIIPEPTEESNIGGGGNE